MREVPLYCGPSYPRFSSSAHRFGSSRAGGFGSRVSGFRIRFYALGFGFWVLGLRVSREAADKGGAAPGGACPRRCRRSLPGTSTAPPTAHVPRAQPSTCCTPLHAAATTTCRELEHGARASLACGSRRANKRWDFLSTPPSRPCYRSPTGTMALMRPSSKGRWGTILRNSSDTQLLSCRQLQAHSDHRIPSAHP